LPFKQGYIFEGFASQALKTKVMELVHQIVPCVLFFWNYGADFNGTESNLDVVWLCSVFVQQFKP